MISLFIFAPHQAIGNAAPSFFESQILTGVGVEIAGGTQISQVYVSGVRETGHQGTASYI
jgi:hypothetical protein